MNITSIGTIAVRLRRCAPAFRATADGSIAVEFALIVPFLTLLAIGAFDLGRGFLEVQRLTNAANAGAQLATYDPDTTADDIVLRVRQDAGEALAVTVDSYCVCPGIDPEPGNAVDCSATVQECTPLAAKYQYLDVSVQNTVDLLLSYPGLPDPLTVDGFVSMRIR